MGWEENVSGDTRLRVSRQLSPTSWTGLQLLTPAGTDISGNADLGIAGNGLVIATATVDNADEDIHQQLLVTEWPEGQLPGTPEVLSVADSWGASLDVNAQGEALVAYAYSGINTDGVTVHRRSPGNGWTLGDSTSNSGDVAAAPDVALSDNGQGQVIDADVENGFYVARTSRILPNGTATPDETVGPTDELVYEVSVDINASGSAQFAWTTKKGGTTRVLSASAANGAYPGLPATLTGTAPDAADPTARISDSGLRVIQHSGNGQVVTHTRTGTGIQPFAPAYSGTGFHADEAVDVDRHGHAVSVGFKPVGGVQGRFFDAAGPTVTLASLPLNTLDTTIPVEWTMQDTLSTIPNTDVYATTAAFNQAGHSSPAVVADNVVGAQADVPAVPGTSYCIQVRPTDAAGNSTTTEERCTTVPLDDRALNGDGRKINNGGTVRVTFDGEVLGSYSLVGTGKKKVINLETFPTVRTGTLTIKVTSANGKVVGIDGVIVAK